MDDGNSQIPTRNSQVPKRSEATILEYADFLRSNISAIYMCRYRCFPMCWSPNVYQYRWLPMLWSTNVYRCDCYRWSRVYTRLTDTSDAYGQNIYMLCETLRFIRHGIYSSAWTSVSTRRQRIRGPDENCSGTSDPLLYERTRAYVRLHKLQQCVFKQ